jgi:hypothetical protein
VLFSYGLEGLKGLEGVEELGRGKGYIFQKI